MLGALAHHLRWAALLRERVARAHYKPDFPDRNDEKFLKTTKASFTGSPKARASSMKRSDTQFIKPRPRSYTAPNSTRETDDGNQDRNTRKSAPGQARKLQRCGALRAPLAARHERHLRHDGDRTNPVTADGVDTTPITYDSNVWRRSAAPAPCASMARRAWLAQRSWTI